MKPAEYRILRERLGSQDKASKVLDVSVATIYLREKDVTPMRRITREAEFALRWAVQQEEEDPTPERTLVKPIQRGRK